MGDTYKLIIPSLFRPFFARVLLSVLLQRSLNWYRRGTDTCWSSYTPTASEAGSPHIATFWRIIGQMSTSIDTPKEFRNKSLD